MLELKRKVNPGAVVLPVDVANYIDYKFVGCGLKATSSTVKATLTACKHRLAETGILRSRRAEWPDRWIDTVMDAVQSTLRFVGEGVDKQPEYEVDSSTTS